MPFGWGNKDKAEIPDLRRFDAFDRALPPDPESIGPLPEWTEAQTARLLGLEFPLYTAFLNKRVHSSVGGGVLRFYLPSTTPSLLSWAAGEWHTDWPSMPRGVIFASDWIGRHFVFAEAGEGKMGEPAMALFSPALGEWIDLDYDFAELLGKGFAKDWRGLLHGDLMDEWRALGNRMPAFGEVVAPRVPVFLGGSDEPEDCSIERVVVAAATTGQLWEQVKDLPPGTTISGVSIE